LFSEALIVLSLRRVALRLSKSHLCYAVNEHLLTHQPEIGQPSAILGLNRKEANDPDPDTEPETELRTDYRPWFNFGISRAANRRA